VAIRILVFI